MVLPQKGLCGSLTAKRASLLPPFCAERRASYASLSPEPRRRKTHKPGTALAEGVAASTNEHRTTSQPMQRERASGSVKISHSQDAQEKREITAREAAVRQLIKIEEEGLFAGHPTNASNLTGPSSAAKQTALQAGRTLPPREQTTVKNLVSGVTRMRRRLDYVLSKLTSRNMESVEPGVRQVLRLALYELEYESLALHALDEHVGLARKVTPASAKYAIGFVNAVLREAGRRVQAGTLPSPKDELESMIASTKASERGLARGLSLVHSHPTWLASRWLKRFGREEAEALMEHNNKPPIYTVRVNPLRGMTVEGLLARFAEEGVEARASHTLPNDFVEIHSGLQTVLAKGFVARGECLVQDVSAGLVVAAALDPQPGERVLDTCAAPGGKTLFCASRMQGTGYLTALDMSAARLQALGRQAEAAGVPRSMMRMHAVDLREFAKEITASLRSDQQAPVGAEGKELREYGTGSQSSGNRSSSEATEDGSSTVKASDSSGAVMDGRSIDQSSSSSSSSSRDGADTARLQCGLWDKVLLDAPCSGSGVLAKRADMRWRRSAQDVEQVLVPLQAELLDSAAALVRPGGLLVYSICSIEEDEGPQQVASFLARHSNFQLEPIDSARLSELGINPYLSDLGCVATFPHRHGVMDGSFASRLRRLH